MPRLWPRCCRCAWQLVMTMTMVHLPGTCEELPLEPLIEHEVILPSSPDAVQENFGVPQNAITFFNEGGQFSKPPTGAAVRAALAQAAAASKPGDALLFHFSGHGTRVRLLWTLSCRHPMHSSISSGTVITSFSVSALSEPQGRLHMGHQQRSAARAHRPPPKAEASVVCSCPPRRARSGP
jgi:hypothetical protein